jgi:membrane-bound lytic murein transglycosylase D
LRRATFIFCLLLAGAPEALGVATQNYGVRGSGETFPEPAFVSRQIHFWEAVFGRYGDKTVIVHDAFYPDVVVDIVDLDVLNARAAQGNLANLGINNANISRTRDNIDDNADGNTAFVLRGRQTRDKIANRYLERYQLAIERFRDMGTQALRYGAMERRVYTVYRRNPNAYADLMSGRVQIRLQGGMRDEFLRAMDRAEVYLPEMERVFRSRGLPVELTRLPFVESMFNLAARSKVGASGIWQFMPSTARNYMMVNAMVDERHSPIKATWGAASLMADNFRVLRSWPLAITAYNHGGGGMARAVKQVGSSSIDQVVQYYRSPSFGFASRNFYAEFRAAVKTYTRLSRERGPNAGRDVQLVALPKRMTVAQILRDTPLTQQTMKKHNPCLNDAAFTRFRNSPLPAGFQMVVPRELAPRVRVAISRSSLSSNGRSYR